MHPGRTGDRRLNVRVTPAWVEGKLPEPESKEKTWAAVVHAASIVSPLWGPLIGWGIFRTGNMKFVAAHAWAALVEFIVLKACLLVAAIISLGFSVRSLYISYQNNWEGFSIWPFLIKFGITWLALLVLGLITTMISIRQAYLAYNGQWPNREMKKADRRRCALEKTSSTVQPEERP